MKLAFIPFSGTQMDENFSDAAKDYRLLLERIPDFSYETVEKMRGDSELGHVREILVGADRYRAKLLRIALVHSFYASAKEQKDGIDYRSPATLFIEDAKQACAYLLRVLTEQTLVNIDKYLPYLVIECRKFVVNCVQLHETVEIISDMVDQVIECWFHRLRKHKTWEVRWLTDLSNSWAVLYEFVAGCATVDRARLRMSEVLDFWITEVDKVKKHTFIEDTMRTMLNELFSLFD
ncbi:hypothetical protein QR680_011434 [Steinernema hermaphroditum]|uniref:Uncharacterized protein n=1 Tax=Steinernema hermaphroditum TaxID=289476 RepID=A0AA39I029_9BILA|nr:hypothetical protein QR680_011434 [Steinernema hermaphroditum]